MRGLIGCEESQTVTMAFRNKGHDFYSLDIQECSGGNEIFHIKDDFFRYISKRLHIYDFSGNHPPCTYLANSGVRWLVRDKPKNGFVWNEELKKYYDPKRWDKMQEAALFFKSMLSIVKSIGKGYIENPIMHKYASEIIGEKYSQIIQPYEFGHKERKATCLWVIGLPLLTPTNNVYEEMMKLPKNERGRLHYLPPSKERAKLRSKTFPGIAEAMAEQWG